LLQLDTARSLDEIVDQLTTEVDPSACLIAITHMFDCKEMYSKDPYFGGYSMVNIPRVCPQHWPKNGTQM